ncbi:hypothetical protein [Egicoccus sp. AB-alg2]|uniref:hypothetical protein n=1 Tax=Egicoccus sp. AB-alg2 TaxID=3242693 RepID=UPI00359E8034
MEQHQRPDGTIEEDATVTGTPREPLTPDMLEQYQRLDGTVEVPTAFDDVDDGPLTPDMLEQRQVVEDDEDEWRE